MLHERFTARVVEDSDNRIHADDVAQSFGFAGALVPGVELFARTTTPLVAAWGEAFFRSGRVDLRFRRPVYDGQQVTVRLDGDRLDVVGDDGVVRCTGSAAPSGPPPDRPAPAAAPPPAGLVDDPAPGPLGSVEELLTAEAGEEYLDAVEEPLALYREQAVAHPGLLLRAVNALLMRNVALGPWIHTASDCTFVGTARLPATMTVHGRVTEAGPRGRHDAVRYDALVLADGAPVLRVDHRALYRLRSG